MSTIKPGFFAPPPQTARPATPKVSPPPPPPPPPAAAPKSTFTSGLEPARRQAPVALSVPQPPPTSTTLRNEVLGDGRSLCLENAFQMARPGDQVVLLADKDDPIGHAVVKHEDGSVSDPANPGARYPDMGSYLAQHRDLGSPVAIPRETLAQILKQPPGPARDAAIRRFGLEGVAGRQVAGEDRFTSPLEADDYVNCRSAPTTSTRDNIQGQFVGNTQLTILDEKTGDDGLTWYLVSGQGVTNDGQPMSDPLQGWVRSDVVAQPMSEEQLAARDTPPPDAEAYNIDSNLLVNSRASNPVPGASLADRTPHYSQGDGLWDQFLLAPENGNTEVTQTELRDGLAETATQAEVNAKEDQVLFSRQTMQSVGCAVTCTAMAISALRAEAGLGPVHPGNVLNGGNVMALGGDVTIGDQVYHRTEQTPLDMEAIRAEIAAGRPVMLQVTPTDPNVPNHYVLITGIDDQGNLTALDPGYRADTTRRQDSPCQEITLTFSGDNSWSSDRYSVPSDLSMYSFSQTP